MERDATLVMHITLLVAKHGNIYIGFLNTLYQRQTQSLERRCLFMERIKKDSDQKWARSESLILIFKITTSDLDLLGDLDQFKIDLDLWVIFDLQFSRSLLYPSLTCKLCVI